MLNYDDNDSTLLQFYNTKAFDQPPHKTLLPHVSELESLPIDKQFDALNGYLTQHSSEAITTEHNLKDPLTGDDLVDVLLRKGAIGSESDKEMSKYLVSSQDFSSQAFLSVVHRDTSIDELMASLEGLDRSIRGQTSQLKLVLDDNFENFVSCKSAIDDVLIAFKNLRSRAQQDLERSKVFNPAARRNKRKIEEGEGLLAELEGAINNLNLASTLMIRPVMDHNAKESKVAKVIEFVQTNKFIFDLPGNLVNSLAAHDHDTFIDDYNKYLNEKEFIEDRQRRALAKAQGDDEAVRAVTLLHSFQNTILSRIYKEVDSLAREYRKKAFLELLSLDHEVTLKSRVRKALDVKFIDLVDKLHRMEGSDSNPIFDFLSSQLERMSKDLFYQRDKFGTKFGLMQKKLSDYILSLSNQRVDGSFVRHIAEKFESVEEYFSASTTTHSLDFGSEREQIIVGIFENSENLDLSIINETWLVLVNFVKYVEEFFELTMSKFVKNYLHYADPASDYNVDPNGVVRTAFFQLVDDIILRLLEIFEPSGPTDQMKVSPTNYSNFIPHHTNSLSAIFYLTGVSQSLSAILTQIGNYTVQIGNTHKSFDTNKQIKRLRESSGLFDQKILEAVCATWVNDCSQFYDLENWEQFKPKKLTTSTSIYTKQIQMLLYYELFVLNKLAGLVVDRPSIQNEEIRIVASYPSKRIVVSLEIQFMRSMNILMDSVVKKFTTEKARVDAEVIKYDIEQCIYKILTMNNFTALGHTVFPTLILKFDKLFDKTLLKQNLKLFADLDKVKLMILDDINEVEKGWIESKIEDHFALVEGNHYIVEDVDIDPFVFECLMHFVNLVHFLKPITDLETFVIIIQQLQTHFLLKFLTCLRAVSENELIIVRILGNVKLDLDFFVEVFEASDTLKLDDYCLNLVQIIVSQIHKVEGMFMDLGYTQESIQAKLNKALRYSENEFSCFV